MTERLRLRLVRVPAVESAPAIRYQTAAEVPARCPRTGCNGLLREFSPGRLCASCGRVFVIDEVLQRRQALEGRA